MIKHVNKAEFEEIIANTNNVMVDFYADWCGPCKMMSPILENINLENEDILTILKVNVEEEKELAALYHIKSIPTLLFFMDGQLKHSFIGFQSKSKIDSFLQITL